MVSNPSSEFSKMGRLKPMGRSVLITSPFGIRDYMALVLFRLCTAQPYDMNNLLDGAPLLSQLAQDQADLHHYGLVSQGEGFEAATDGPKIARHMLSWAKWKGIASLVSPGQDGDNIREPNATLEWHPSLISMAKRFGQDVDSLQLTSFRKAVERGWGRIGTTSQPSSPPAPNSERRPSSFQSTPRYNDGTSSWFPQLRQMWPFRNVCHVKPSANAVFRGPSVLPLKQPSPPQPPLSGDPQAATGTSQQQQQSAREEYQQKIKQLKHLQELKKWRKLTSDCQSELGEIMAWLVQRRRRPEHATLPKAGKRRRSLGDDTYPSSRIKVPRLYV